MLVHITTGIPERENFLTRFDSYFITKCDDYYKVSQNDFFFISVFFIIVNIETTAAHGCSTRRKAVRSCCYVDSVFM